MESFSTEDPDVPSSVVPDYEILDRGSNQGQPILIDGHGYVYALRVSYSMVSISQEKVWKFPDLAVLGPFKYNSDSKNPTSTFVRPNISWQRNLWTELCWPHPQSVENLPLPNFIEAYVIIGYTVTLPSVFVISAKDRRVPNILAMQHSQ